MIDFIINNMFMLADCSILGDKFNSLLQEAFTWIKIVTPILVLLLCSFDMGKAAMAQDEKAMKEALSNSVKRLIIGVAIFFLPMVINLLLDFAGSFSSTCGVG